MHIFTRWACLTTDRYTALYPIDLITNCSLILPSVSLYYNYISHNGVFFLQGWRMTLWTGNYTSTWGGGGGGAVRFWTRLGHPHTFLVYYVHSASPVGLTVLLTIQDKLSCLVNIDLRDTTDMVEATYQTSQQTRLILIWMRSVYVWEKIPFLSVFVESIAVLVAHQDRPHQAAPVPVQDILSKLLASQTELDSRYPNTVHTVCVINMIVIIQCGWFVLLYVSVCVCACARSNFCDAEPSHAMYILFNTLQPKHFNCIKESHKSQAIIKHGRQENSSSSKKIWHAFPIQSRQYIW